MHFSTTKKWKDMDPNRKVNLYKEKKKKKEELSNDLVGFSRSSPVEVGEEREAPPVGRVK